MLFASSVSIKHNWETVYPEPILNIHFILWLVEFYTDSPQNRQRMSLVLYSIQYLVSAQITMI